MKTVVDKFIAEIETARQVCRLLGNSVKIDTAPGRFALGEHQFRLLQAMYETKFPDIREFVSQGMFEQIITQDVHIGQFNAVFGIVSLDANNIAKMIKFGDKLLLQLRIMEHNLSLASGTNGEAHEGQLDELMSRMKINDELFKYAMNAMRAAKTDAERDTLLRNYEQKTLSLSHEEIVLVARHLIIPDLEKALREFRLNAPEANEVYRTETTEEYDRMTAAHPEFKDKFDGTQNPYFEAFDDGRKVEAIAVTAYNFSEDYARCSYRQCPVKRADWQKATALDAEAFFATTDFDPR